jgi:hypothetical protein
MSIEDKAKHPWARMLGLVAGMGVAVICVYRGLDPEVILFRSLCAGVACGVVVVLMRVTMSLFNS